MVALDALVVATALGAIKQGLGASLGQLEWTVNAYTLSFAVLLMAASVLGDRFGRLGMFTAGLGLFTAASAACALAPTVGWLIAARAVQGAGRRHDAVVTTPSDRDAAHRPRSTHHATLHLGGASTLTLTRPSVLKRIVDRASIL